jgi:diadenosine tetraphosphate (Ap4A) HIT family hydrolase
MKEPAAGCALCEAATTGPLYADHLWHVRHIEPPWGVAGWMLLVANRHVSGPAAFDDAEARGLGIALRHCQRLLVEVTGAQRVYTAALGERYPHFHAHMIPRYSAMPRGASGFAVFDLQRAAAAGEVEIDPAEVARLSAAYAAALGADPIPPA